MLGGHGSRLVEFGGIEGNLIHLGDATSDERLCWACALILVQPVEEELLKQHGLSPCCQDLDLFTSDVDRGES